MKAGDPVTGDVEVENTGPVEGDEGVQVYLRDVEASLPVPWIQLAGFTRIRLAPGAKQTVQFSINERQMSFADENGNWVLEPGTFDVWAAGQSPDLISSIRPENEAAGEFIISK